MQRIMILLVACGALACQQYTSSPWFEGDLESARAEAAERGTVVMLEFYTDWCSWCKRLEKDTFSKPEVRRELESMVAVKLDAEKEGADLAGRYEVDSFPTLIFLEADGTEIDRVIGYLPPESFLERVARVRAGDTFLACLRQLDEDPGNVEAIARSVDGLLERSDPIGAISRVEAFHQATDGQELGLCRKLMFSARAELHARAYQRAAKLYRRGWDRGFDVPDTAGTARLHGLIAEGLASLPADEQADLLRTARFDDAGVLLEIPDVDGGAPEELFEVAGFAYRSGHYHSAAQLYRSWYQRVGSEAEAAVLNDVAWKLYLVQQEIELAIEIAERAYAANPDPDTTDTLARLLYVSGAVENAVMLERQAAEAAEGPRSETFRGVASRMEAGESLDDRPSFDSYPGSRRVSL